MRNEILPVEFLRSEIEHDTLHYLILEAPKTKFLIESGLLTVTSLVQSELTANELSLALTLFDVELNRMFIEKMRSLNLSSVDLKTLLHLNCMPIDLSRKNKIQNLFRFHDILKLLLEEKEEDLNWILDRIRSPSLSLDNPPESLKKIIEKTESREERQLREELCHNYIKQILSRNASGEEKLSSEILEMLGIQQNKPNDYEVLEITTLSPTKKEIEAAFRRKGLLCHPDKHPQKQDVATEAFKRLSQARDNLIQSITIP